MILDLQHPSIQYIQKLNLQYLVFRLVKKQNWILPEAEEAVRKYKNYLILRYIRSDFEMMVPTYEIDEVWHNHILYTRNYMNDCYQIFGFYLHHTPSSTTEENQDTLSDLYLQTARAYEKLFQESYGSAFDITSWYTPMST